MTKEDLQQIKEMVDTALDEKLAPINERLNRIEEDTAVTREATNALLEWADNVAVITGERFPVKRPQKAE